MLSEFVRRGRQIFQVFYDIDGNIALERLHDSYPTEEEAELQLTLLMGNP